MLEQLDFVQIIFKVKFVDRKLLDCKLSTLLFVLGLKAVHFVKKLLLKL